MTYILKTPEETLEFGMKIGKKLKPGNIVCLQGDLGAGKTVIAKGIAISLEVTQNITSPTFNIVCEYSGKFPLYHMDLYRISGYEEFEQLGVDDLIYGSGVTLIEWSERIAEELPENIITLHIKIIKSNQHRQIYLEGLEL